MSNIGYIQITRICNQDCLFCSNPANERMKTVEEVKEAVDDFVRRKYRGIIFTGGEPTVYPHLIEVMQYAQKKGIENRLISNGQMLADPKFCRKLIEAGLTSIHISLYSYQKKLHDFLTTLPGSYDKLMKALQNLKDPRVSVATNCVINKYNADHLHKTAVFILKNFPHVKHFIWNNMDTMMVKKEKLALKLWAQLPTFRDSLSKAAKLVAMADKTFRVEKVPLCYMEGFEEFSTETRKIVQSEERRVYFLDEREIMQQSADNWRYSLLPKCKRCDLFTICAGLYHSNDFYKTADLKPVKKDSAYKATIIRRILATSENK